VSDVRRRLERLEASNRGSAIRLFGEDGRVLYEYFGNGDDPHVGLACYLSLVERIEAADENVLRTMRHCVAASQNFGLLWQMLRALAEGVDRQERGPEPCSENPVAPEEEVH